MDQKNRERILSDLRRYQKEGKCMTSFAFRDASTIDEVGIREANRLCMQEVMTDLLKNLKKEDKVDIFIDGCDNYIFDIDDVGYTFSRISAKKKLKLPQKTGLEKIQVEYVIGGDRLNPCISLASIIAKVERDRMMCEYSENFPMYHFSEHKGYGTKKHRDALLNYGITPIHRKSYAPIKRLILGES